MPESQEWNKRFERFELKLDRIGEALSTLARLDEKLVNQQDSLSKGYERMTTIEAEMDGNRKGLNVIGELARKSAATLSVSDPIETKLLACKNADDIKGFKRVVWGLISLCGTALVLLITNSVK